MYSKNTYLININKNIVHVWESEYFPGMSVYLMEDGNLLRTKNLLNPNFLAGGTGGGVQEISPDGTVLWDFEYSNETHCSHHDIELLPNGNILIIAWEAKSFSQAISAGRNPDLLSQNILWVEKILEIEPIGNSGANIVWEWSVWDHLIQDFDSTKDNYGIVQDHPELIDINYMGSQGPDWLHINSIDYNEDLDQILLSVNFLSEIWVIDHGGNSDVRYRWGNPLAYKAGDVNDKKLSHIHDAQWIKNGLPGQGNILYFNNGIDRTDGRYSSVEEIMPPLIGYGNYEYTPGQPYGPEEQVWIYGDNLIQNFYSYGQSGAQRLPNGNTLICEADEGRFFEINENGSVIWDYINPYPTVLNNDVFKIIRYKPDYPGLDPLVDNFPPNTPMSPHGPTSCFTNINYEYLTKSVDPDNDEIQFGWDWNNDNIVDDWTDFYYSDEMCYMNYTWFSPGLYNVKVKARDINGEESNWSDSLIVNIEIDPLNNPPITPTVINGPTSGSIGVNYTYSTRTTDPDDDNLYYLFDWGDNSKSDWIGPLNSGEKARGYHSWNEKKSYSIRVKAKDVYGSESEWSDPLTITLPKSNYQFFDLLLNYFENYPIIYKILYLLF